MKRLVVVLALVLAGGAARADKAAPPRLVTPPSGWVENTDQAKRVKSQLEMELMSEDATVEVYGWQPAERGALLLASLVTVEMPPERMGEWVRTQIDEIHDTPAMMAGKEGKTRTISWSETADSADLEYANDELGTVSVVHVAWVRRAHADGAPDTIEEYKGECMVSADSAAQYQKPCTEAIAGLTLPAAAERLKIDTPARVADSGDDDDDEEAGSGSGSAAASGSATGSGTGTGTGTGTGSGPTMSTAPDGAPLGPIITTKPASKGGTDMRPFWIAGGLLVLIAVLLWSRKKRQDLIAEDERRKQEDEARAKAKKEKKAAEEKKVEPKKEEPKKEEKAEEKADDKSEEDAS